MSTITREFTKEQLQQIIETDHVQCGEASSLARVALASLEAEPVAWLLSGGGAKNNVSFDSGNAYADPLREVTPLYTAPPAPVSVPDEVISAIENLKRTLVNCNRYNYCSDAVKRLEGACRAAMLQGADGNSPVIPDGWVACSERMPDDDDFVYIWPRPDFGVELHVGQYCECHPKGDGWYAQVYEQNYGIEWCPITVTHWMPLPAAPQQEVTQALAKGMERYGDAMQKLADSGD
ncbi:DUF551 domain-containing protein [Enterobacter roggenkampii]|uniref:DUF551 domain-containing protein n=1 Tax=Enterobacter roggenkampii TaxID=1812935 RepID=UPI002073BFB4|nr:DUF551 domain-containing protein [Enterobacter roggenkampii]MDN3750927.1 DUF551 domain-containing protein [Enterobacter roggenkampii]MDN3760038.1 DUF551 domain-containing protein [Enterobacter roggenkampii]MDN3770484.1 DUF551 domain-containing protein [Enterobacter roggenkampii]